MRRDRSRVEPHLTQPPVLNIPRGAQVIPNDLLRAQLAANDNRGLAERLDRLAARVDRLHAEVAAGNRQRGAIAKETLRQWAGQSGKLDGLRRTVEAA